MTATESFRTALKKLIETRGHGAQAELADALNMHRSAINDMLAGRRGASARMQEKVAAHFGLTLGEMLRIGENLISGRIVFPWSDQLEGLDRCHQVLKIVELTNAQVGGSNNNLPFLQRVCEFMEGKITPAQLYQEYLLLVRRCCCS
jgi:transcriptional regulator with XRE-family HTH domain